MRWRCFDLEAVAHERAAEWLEPVQPDARLKDPVKIAESIQQKTDERNDKLGLDPDCCRIVALGWVDVGYGDPVCLLCRDEAEEKAALVEFFSAFAKHEIRLVTFYGHAYDIPVLLRRALYLGVKHPKISLDRYRSPHVDVWNELTYRGALRTAHSLKFYQKRWGLPSLDKVDGADVARLWAAGETEAVKEHCLSDVAILHALANKMRLLDLAEGGLSERANSSSPF